jgi:hypothetical protein
MKKKPFSIKFFAACFLVAPIFNLSLIAWLNHWPLTGPRGVLGHLSPYELCLISLFPFTAYGIWKVAKWGYYLFLSFSTLIIIHNFYILLTQKQYSSYMVLLFQATTLSVVGFFLQKHITAPYFNPKMRWWESRPRYKVDVGCVNKISEGASARLFESHIHDISKGGCFMVCSENLKIDTQIELEFSFNNNRVLILGETVWLCPKIQGGYGIQFHKMSLLNKLALRAIIKDLKSKKTNTSFKVAA